MVEPIMYMAIGFLVSMLLGLMVLPLVHNRAVRLTTKRLEAAAPVSMAEVQADKDQLRAEFAMAARRLEMNVEQLQSKTASQSAELGKRSDAVNRMKLELGEKNATIFSLEARERAIKDQLRVATEELESKAQALQSAEQTLADRHAELARLGAELNDRSQTADSRQIELTAVHSRIESLSQRVSDLDTQLIAQVKEAESLGQEADTLRQQATVQAAQLAERNEENVRLRAAREEAETTVKQLREEVFALNNNGASPALSALQAETAGETAKTLREEREAFQRDRAGNELLRERIGDIAAEVARLTMTLEGPESPINAILEAELAHPAANGSPATAPGETLADRIRALQSQANRHPA